MGFTNTQYTDAINSMVSSQINILNNPLYIFNDKSKTIVDYYNKDLNMSTLDEGLGVEYDSLGPNCPSKFNWIHDALLYGIEKIQLHYESDEDGVFSDDITGEAYVLPNTFIPQVGDFFEIKYVKERILFIVTEVQTDTLENGYNFYKIGYKSDAVGLQAINSLHKYNLNKQFNMLPSAVGTSMKCVIESSDYEFIRRLEDEAVVLKEYYVQLFFSNPLQTFVYLYNTFHIYDPYLIEFLMRNNILAGTGEYVYIDHAMEVWQTFGIDYDYTFFRALEKRSIEKADSCNVMAVANQVTDIMSLMTKRLEDYFYIDMNINKYAPFLTKIETIPNAIIDCITRGEKLDTTIYPKFYHIIIDYFDPGREFTIHDLTLLDNITENDPKDLFYGIPMLIFVLEQRVKALLATV